jgi:hypothetical protein
MGGAKGVLQKAHRRLKKALQLPQRNSIANDDAIVVGCLPEPDKTGQWPRKTSLGQSVSESQVCSFSRLKVLRMTLISNFGLTDSPSDGERAVWWEPIRPNLTASDTAAFADGAAGWATETRRDTKYVSLLSWLLSHESVGEKEQS